MSSFTNKVGRAFNICIIIFALVGYIILLTFCYLLFDNSNDIQYLNFCAILILEIVANYLSLKIVGYRPFLCGDQHEKQQQYMKQLFTLYFVIILLSYSISIQLELFGGNKIRLMLILITMILHLILPSIGVLISTKRLIASFYTYCKNINQPIFSYFCDSVLDYVNFGVKIELPKVDKTTADTTNTTNPIANSIRDIQESFAV